MFPIALSYFILGNWFFGWFGCKVFFALESVNKLLSMALLVVMSFERFCAVSRPVKFICIKCEFFDEFAFGQNDLPQI